MKRSTEQERRERIRQYHQSKSTTRKTETADAGSLAPQEPARPATSKGRFGLFLLVCLIGSIAVSYGIFKFVAPAVIAPSNPSELVGKWEVTDDHFKGATMEFTWHGTAIATFYEGNAKQVAKAAVKVEGKRLLFTGKNPETREAVNVVHTIINLTENEMVILGEDKVTYHMVRVKR